MNANAADIEIANGSATTGLEPAELIKLLGQQAREASQHIAVASPDSKSAALHAMADAIDEAAAVILSANAEDLAAARERDLTAALLDRLELTPARVASMAQGLRDIAAQDDPIGSLSATTQRPSGLKIARMRVPLGVIGVIYESRPNVTADAAAIALKAGNAVILRGGSEAIRSNRAIAECVHAGLLAAGLPEHTVQLVGTTDREAVGALLQNNDGVDVIIPRGGKNLVARVAAEARVPVIKHLDGLCHVYIDEHADADKALAVSVNAKCYRYGICGAMETLLIHADQAQSLLPRLAEGYAQHNVELRGCARTQAVLPGVTAATDEDWATEYLAPILSIRVVDSIEEAMAHIARFGSGHTDAILTENIGRANQFVRGVDSSSVMVNAATCFADGAEYGLGAEIGISTDRLHVRGPVGVLGLTTEKYVVTGDGTTR